MFIFSWLRALRRTTLLAVVVGVLLLMAPPVLQTLAQGNITLDVFRVDVSPQSEFLRLAVNFTVRDSRNRSPRFDRVEYAALERARDSNFVAQIEYPIESSAAPLYLLVLIDTSTSMAGAIDDVQRALESSLGNVNDATFVAVHRFSEQVTRLQDFTNERSALMSAVDQLGDVSGPTCLYDSLVTGVDELERIDAGEGVRRAIVIFTDGKDEKIVGDRVVGCSSSSLQEVFNRAEASAIPISTIGLGTDASNSNLNPDELTQIAQRTGGFYAIGGQDVVGRLFEEVFAGIGSQYVAYFNVLAKPGDNYAFMALEIEGVPGRLESRVFTFNSPVDYLPEPTPSPTPEPPTPTPLPTDAPTPEPPTPTPLPTAVPQIMVLSNRSSEPGIFDLEVSIDRPSGLYLLLVQLWDATGVMKNEQVVEPRQVQTIRIDTSALQGGEYRVRFLGWSDANRTLILVPPDPFGGQDEAPTTLQEFPFTYQPPPPAPIRALVRSLETDPVTNQLVIGLDISQQDAVDKYQAFINNEAQQKVIDSGLQVYRQDGTLRIDKPAAALTPVPEPVEQEYALLVTLYKDDNEAVPMAAYEFSLVPPPAPGFFEQLMGGLQRNPLISIGMAIVLVASLVWFMGGRRQQKQSFQLSRSAEEYTVAYGAGSEAHASPAGKGARVTVEVLETPAPVDRHSHTLKNLPAKVGRSQTCQVRFEGDLQISKEHLRISVEGSTVKVTDLGSANGTFVDEQRLAANESVPVGEGQVVRLGKHTKLRIGLRYS